MAEKSDKKPEKKEAPKADNTPFQWGIEIILIIIIGLALVRLFARFGNGGSFLSGDSAWSGTVTDLYYSLTSFFLGFTIVSNIISAFLLMGIIYSAVKLGELGKAEYAKLYPVQPEAGSREFIPLQESKWERIMKRMSSENESDWKLAILEADIVLDELLDKIGSVGNSIGDKLKKVERSDFRTIDQAWEAHKIRNAIAHEGEKYPLSKREARHAISLYESVFREFNYI